MSGHDESVKVLLVEDDAVAAALATAEISGSTLVRFVIDHAATLAEALSALDAAPYDLVLIDLGLPDAFGLQALQELVGHHRQACCVVVSATRNTEISLAAVQLGAQGFIYKGASSRFDTEQTLLAALARHRRLEAMASAAVELREVFAALPAAILVINQEGRVVAANAAAGVLYDRDPRWLVGQRFGAKVPVEGPQSLRIQPYRGDPLTVEMRATSAQWQGKPSTLVSLREPWPLAAPVDPRSE